MLVQLQKNWPAESPPPHPQADAESGILSVDNIVAILRRRALLIGAALAAMLVVGLAYLVTTKPMFDSTALVYLDVENAQVIGGNDSNASGMPPSLSDVDVNSQLQIIKSEKIALAVIDQLGIKDADEFMRPQNMIAQLAQRGLGIIRSMVRLGPPPAAVEEAGVPRSVVEAFGKRLSVDRVADTFVIAIGFTSEDKQRAADVANAVSNAYLEEKLDARYESVRRASTWLEGRLAELREKAVASDQLVEQYKRENGIIDTNAGNGQLLSDAQLERSFRPHGGGAEGDGDAARALRPDRPDDRVGQSERLRRGFAGQQRHQRNAPAIFADRPAGGRHLAPLWRRA